MTAAAQSVAPDFWIVKDGRKYLGVIRLKDGLYVPWFEAKQIGDAKGTLEAAIDVLAGA